MKTRLMVGSAKMAFNFCVGCRYPEFGSMIGATFVQGEAADIYTNPPANYQMSSAEKFK